MYRRASFLFLFVAAMLVGSYAKSLTHNGHSDKLEDAVFSIELSGQKDCLPMLPLASQEYTSGHSRLGHCSLSMRFHVVLGALIASGAAHPQEGSLIRLPLDIGVLLKSLAPAPVNDPRFTNFKPAGSGDGKLTILKLGIGSDFK